MSGSPQALQTPGSRQTGPVWLFWLPLFFTAHLAYTAAFIGLRTEHFLLYFLVLFLCFGSGRTRLFLKTAFPFWIFGACYDSIRLIPGEWKPEIHVADLYFAEKFLFGIPSAGSRLTLAEYFSSHNTPILDFLAGIFYLTYLLVFFSFFLYIFRRDVEKARRLSWSFCILNLLGILTFQLVPAAPPWYVEQYGLGPADPGTPPHPAGALRFDALVGAPVCASLYRKSPDVFGALPSLHVANPLLLYLFARFLGSGWARGSLLYALAVAFSAVYLNHHYVLDIAAGGLYAWASYLLFPWRRDERAAGP